MYHSLLTMHHTLTTHYSLLTTHYSLLPTPYSLLTTHYALRTTHCPQEPDLPKDVVKEMKSFVAKSTLYPYLLRLTGTLSGGPQSCSALLLPSTHYLLRTPLTSGNVWLPIGARQALISTPGLAPEGSKASPGVDMSAWRAPIGNHTPHLSEEYCLLATTYYLPSATYYLLPTTTTYYLLPTTTNYYLLPSTNY